MPNDSRIDPPMNRFREGDLAECWMCGRALEFLRAVWWERGTDQMQCAMQPSAAANGYSPHHPINIVRLALPDFSDQADVERWLES